MSTKQDVQRIQAQAASISDIRQHMAADPVLNKPGEVGDGWKPIATAPKDGTMMLGYGRWCEGARFSIWVIEWVEIEQMEEVGDDMYRKVKTGKWTNAGFTATHWMPLPAAPDPDSCPECGWPLSKPLGVGDCKCATHEAKHAEEKPEPTAAEKRDEHEFNAGYDAGHANSEGGR